MAAKARATDHVGALSQFSVEEAMPCTSTITGVLAVTGPSVKRWPKSRLGPAAPGAVAVKHTFSTFIWPSKCMTGSAALATGAPRAQATRAAARDREARFMADGLYPARGLGERPARRAPRRNGL